MQDGSQTNISEKRSSYNIYKRNSVKMSKSGDGPSVTGAVKAAGDDNHLNEGLVLFQ